MWKRKLSNFQHPQHIIIYISPIINDVTHEGTYWLVFLYQVHSNHAGPFFLDKITKKPVSTDLWYHTFSWRIFNQTLLFHFKSIVCKNLLLHMNSGSNVFTDVIWKLDFIIKCLTLSIFLKIILEMESKY